MHGQRIIHRDLKGVHFFFVSPGYSLSQMDLVKANILIDETGHACLADFGLLVIISDGTWSSFTQRGTPRWMSPELFYPEDFGLKDSHQTERSDRYALAIVILYTKS